MLYFICWVIALASYDQTGPEPTRWMEPPGWTGNFWGPAATLARADGRLPPLPSTPAMARWRDWGRGVLREGDVVFRMGDARTLRGLFPLSLFIAKATNSAFSHTGIVAIEDGSPVVYHSPAAGVQRQPFEVWMLDCVGSLGVKRLRPEHRRHIPGVLAYCRRAFESQVPFDFEFRMDDAKLYCLELTEKAFRSQGLALSEAVRIGDWENLADFPLTALCFVRFSGLILDRPISLDQPVYVPGNGHEGVWASPLLERVFGPEPRCAWTTPEPRAGGVSFRGDVEMLALVFNELRRSYAELPVGWLSERLLPRVRAVLGPTSEHGGRRGPRRGSRAGRPWRRRPRPAPLSALSSSGRARRWPTRSAS